MKLKMKRATTSKLVRLFIQDATSTTGAGLTGLTNASAGLVAYYCREGDATATVITLSAGTIGTWSSGGFAPVDAANLPGVYELGLPNAALASGASVVAMLKGATNMVPCVLEVELDAADYQDAAALGLTRLDAAISSRATPAQILATPANLIATDGSGRVTVGSIVAGAIAAATFAAGALDAVWSTAARTLTAFGFNVLHDMTQAVPTTNTAQTVGDALNAARASGFGRWTLVGTTLTLYAADGTTIVRSFVIDSAVSPTSRT